MANRSRFFFFKILRAHTKQCTPLIASRIFQLVAMFLMLFLGNSAQGAVVSGTVFLYDSTTGENTTPITEEGLTVYATQTKCDSTTPIASSSVSTLDGSYSITVDAGENSPFPSPSPSYYFWVESASQKWRIDWLGGISTGYGEECDSATPLFVSANEIYTENNFYTWEVFSISGQVFETDGISPVINSSVYLTSHGLCGGTYPEPHWSIDVHDGTYHIENLDANRTYYFSAKDPDGIYLRSYWTTDGGGGNCKISTPIAADAGDSLNNVDFRLEKASVLEGTVKNTSGLNPMLGTVSTVALYSGNPCKWQNKLVTVEVDENDATFRFTELAAGRYYAQLKFTEGNYTGGWWTPGGLGQSCEAAAPVVLDEGEVLSEFDLLAAVGGSVSGHIYMEDGVTPVINKNIPVIVMQHNPCNADVFYQGIVSGAVNPIDGSFTIDRIPPGNYTLYVHGGDDLVSEWWRPGGSAVSCQEASVISIASGEEVTEKNFQLDTGGIIRGTLYHDDGTTPLQIPSSEGTVYLLSGDTCGLKSYINRSYPPTLEEMQYPRNIVSTSSPDPSSGEFSMGGLAEGAYYLYSHVYSENYTSEWWSSTGSVFSCENLEPIYIEKGEVREGVNFQHTAGASISGSVLVNDGSVPITGNNIMIQVVSEDPCSENADISFETSIDTLDGSYHIDQLPPGSYYLHSRVLQGNWVDAWYDGSTGASDCSAAVPIEVGVAEHEIGKNFKMQVGATISGTVYSKDGTAPILYTFVAIRAYKENPCSISDQISWSREIDRTAGSYVLGGLEPGNYYLYADDYVDNYVNEWWSPSGSTVDCAKAISVQVTQQAEITGYDFQLNFINRMAGDVSQDGDVTLADAVILIQALTGNPSHSVWSYGDVNDDDKVDVREAIYILQDLASE